MKKENCTIHQKKKKEKEKKMVYLLKKQSSDSELNAQLGIETSASDQKKNKRGEPKNSNNGGRHKKGILGKSDC